MQTSVALLIIINETSETITLLLQSILLQTQLPSELVITGNNSSDEVINIINEFSRTSSIPIKHIWNKEEKSNKSEILNQIIVNSQSDYIIQIAGNSILHKNFIRDHFKRSKGDAFLYGTNIVDISPDSVNNILENNIIKFGFFSKNIINRSQNIYISSLSRSKATEFYSKEMKSCNFSFWKRDFIYINGYNEFFEGWNEECCTDLFYRLLFSGVKGKEISNVAIIYCLPLLSDPVYNHNNTLLLRKTKKEKIIICEKGIKITKPYKKVHLN